MFKERSLNFSYNTKLLGVVGKNIHYTLSPYIHNFIFAENNIDAVYLAFDIDDRKFDRIIPGLLEIAYGVNVTIPYKERIMQYLDSLDVSASIVEAVNTIKDRKGYNTDYIALYNLIKKKMNFDIETCVIFGAGGAARAAIGALWENDCNEIEIINRSHERAEKLIQRLRSQDINVNVREGCNNLTKIDVLVNATPNPDMIPDECIKLSRGVIEFVYTPVETSLIRKAKRYNIPIINGIEILVKQAIEAEKIWFGINVEEERVVNYLYARKLIR